jgi:hypothetical protein
MIAHSRQSGVEQGPVGLATRDGAYLHAVASILRGTAASKRDWLGKPRKLPQGWGYDQFPMSEPAQLQAPDNDVVA